MFDTRRRYFPRMPSDDPRIVLEPITLAEVRELARRGFGDMIKASVDVGRRLMAIGGDLHSDEEALLLDDGAKQIDVWGINLYPDQPEETWIEFDSMINVRPSQGNRSRGVEDPAIRSEIQRIVSALVQR